MITLTLHSSQSPNHILSALRERAGEWHVSQLPDVLRRSSVLAVECQLQGNVCTLRYARRWHAGVERGAPLRLRAAVESDRHGGTTVRVVVRHEAHLRLQALGIAILGIAAVGLLRFPVWAVAGLVSGLAGLNYLLVREANRGLTRRSEPEAEYLIRRVESVLAGADEPSAVAPAS